MKRRWTCEQWLDYGRRVRELGSRLTVAIKMFPRTRGLPSGSVGDFSRAFDSLEACKRELQGPYEAQMLAGGGEYPYELVTLRRPADDLEYLEGDHHPTLDIIPPRQWIAIGKEWKWINAETGHLLTSLGGTLSGRHRAVRNLEKMHRALSGARCKLDSVVFGQYPEWDHAARVFYGPGDPNPEGAGLSVAGTPEPRRTPR